MLARVQSVQAGAAGNTFTSFQTALATAAGVPSSSLTTTVSSISAPPSGTAAEASISPAIAGAIAASVIAAAAITVAVALVARQRASQLASRARAARMRQEASEAGPRSDAGSTDATESVHIHVDDPNTHAELAPSEHAALPGASETLSVSPPHAESLDSVEGAAPTSGLTRPPKRASTAPSVHTVTVVQPMEVESPVVTRLVDSLETSVVVVEQPPAAHETAAGLTESPQKRTSTAPTVHTVTPVQPMQAESPNDTRVVESVATTSAAARAAHDEPATTAIAPVHAGDAVLLPDGVISTSIVETVEVADAPSASKVVGPPEASGDSAAGLMILRARAIVLSRRR